MAIRPRYVGHHRSSRGRALYVAAWALAALFAGTEAVLLIFDRADSSLCANARLRARVQWELSRQPALSLDALASEIHSSKAVVLDAMGQDRRVGVGGQELSAVWELLDSWPDPVFIAWGPGHSFEFHGLLAPTHSDPRHDSLAFESAGGAVLGRLRPSEIGAIYAYTAHTQNGETPELLFLDRSGNLTFEVVPGATLRQATQTLPIDFVNTVRQMKLLAQACDKP